MTDHCCCLNHVVFLPPIIMGDATVNEGDTLSLSCDSSNSHQLPHLQWVNETGEIVSSSALLEFTNIMRSQAGTYTCRTTPPNPDNSTSSSLTVVVQCKTQSCISRPLLGFVSYSYMLYHLRWFKGKNIGRIHPIMMA